jgi:hypothetical protein
MLKGDQYMNITKFVPALFLGFAIACGNTPNPSITKNPTVIPNTATPTITALEANQKITDGIKNYATQNEISKMWDIVKPETVGNIKNFSIDKRFVLYSSVATDSQGFSIPGLKLYLVDILNLTVTQVGSDNVQLMDGSVSQDGKKVAVIEVGGQILDVWDSETKILHHVLTESKNQYFTLPTWNKNNLDVGFLIDRIVEPENTNDIAQKAKLASIHVDSSKLRSTASKIQMTELKYVSGVVSKIEWINDLLLVVNDSRLTNRDAYSPGIKVGNVVNLKMPYAVGDANLPNAYYGHSSYDVPSLDFGAGMAARGEKVLAIAPGTIVGAEGSNSICGGQGTPGNYVIVSHLGTDNVLYSSHYYHLIPSIANGAGVTQGAQLGTVNCIGYTIGSGPGDPPGRWSHIHLTLRSGSNAYYGGTAAAPEPMDGYSDFTAGNWYTSTNSGTAPPPPPAPCSYGWTPGGAWTRQISDNDQDFNDGQGMEKLGLDYWWLDGGNGSGGNTLYTYSGNIPDQTYGKWSTYVPRGQYDVYAYIPSASGNNDGQNVGNSYADDVNYKVQSFSGTIYNTTAVNQSVYRGCWIKLGGGYNWVQGDHVAVQLGDNVSGATYRRIYFDDIAYFRTARPIWTLSPNGLTLPAGTVGGTTSSATYTATNSGGLSGTGALSATNGFTVSQPGVGLSAGQAFNMTVTAPACTVAGTQTSTITMTGDDTSATLNVSRVCNAAIAIWTTNAGTAFAAGTVGGITANVPITLTNTGNAAGNYTVGVTNGFTASPTSGSLAAGASVSITATAPVCTSTANQTAVITFGGSSSASNNLTRGCIGVPIWTPSVSSLILTSGIVGGTTSSNTFNLQNTGTASGTYTLTASSPFTVNPAIGTLANGSSTPITVTAAACTVVGTQTSSISIAGSTSTIIASRVCTVAIPAIPLTPTVSALTVSSNGRIFVTWNESTGADQYEFAGTFDTNTPLNFSSGVNARGSGVSGAVLVWGLTPEDPVKQGKQLCVQIRAKNTEGSSNYTSPVCTTYKYYTGVSLKNSSPVVTISLP